ncbi:MAG: hypothetical protein CME88_14965 [Hirschia sp.]|nr:hypothetical protein [Hirschia sp.]MBF19677.1 hypothetical protein [Hirschia sp.]
MLAALLAAFSIVWLQYTQYHDRYSRTLETYIQERGKREASQFQQLEKAHAIAEGLFLATHEHLTDAEIAAGFDKFFDEAEDGSFRSRDGVYDGMLDRNLGWISGIGAMGSSSSPMTIDRKRTVYSALLAIARTAPSFQSEIESLWYFTPTNDIVIHAPNRPDNLEFYRKTAPSSFRVQDHATFLDNITWENNPDGVTLCTALSRLVYVQDGVALTAGCQTPSRLGTQQFGAWGTTMPMAGPFKRAVSETPMPEAELFLLGPKGELMAHPDLVEADNLTYDAIEEVIPKVRIDQLMTRIHAKDQQYGVISDRWFGLPGDIYSFYEIETPGWFVIVKLEKGFIFSEALHAVTPVFLATVLLIALTIYALSYLITHYGIRPIGRLARTFANVDGADRDNKDTLSIHDLLERNDELGDLARSLNGYHERSIENVELLEKKVSERTSELQRATDAKTIFLANMSHELRTPLNGILGISGSLRRRTKCTDTIEMADLIEQSALTLEKLLSDVLDISKVESGQLELEETQFNLNAALRSVIDLQAISADDKGLRIETDLDDRCDAVFTGDPVRLKQIATNLLSNAVKFTDDGHVRFSLRQIAEQGDRRSFTMTVEDTGCGIALEDQDNIFDRFSQANPTIHRKYGGTGLGLSIVRSLVELLGGALTVKSNPGVGSQFICTFDLLATDLEAQPPQFLRTDHMPTVQQDPKASSGNMTASDEPIRILLAEDHAVNRRVVELILDSQGIEVVSVTNGREAIDTFAKEAFDLVLMDVRMPECSGLDATRRIRSMEAKAASTPVPIIMLSADTSDHDIQTAERAGATMHISKPITPEKLLSAIASVLENDRPVFEIQTTGSSRPAQSSSSGKSQDEVLSIRSQS